MKSEKVFITGCDHTNEWMMPWFVENYKKHNTAPLIFADFGVSDLNKIKSLHNFYALMNAQSNDEGKGWFKKPKVMCSSPSEKTVWLDTDCQVLTNIEDIFDLLEPNKLNMVEDKPWTARRGTNGPWYNSGVVGFIGQPMILKNWAEWVKNTTESGDQEVLYAKLDMMQKLTYINPLPNEYNWLRLQLENDNQDSWNKKIIHWTGHKGKLKIKEMMNV
tara:strand:+ start:102 stop:755 length:654 start_codon:yes stop_codon:yes gene_type:complete